MEWPKRARTADWENGVLALDREKQFEVPEADRRDHGAVGRLHPGGLPCERVSGDG